MNALDPVPAREVTFTATTDVVVVGLGVAGCCAALGAREAGAEVVALECAGATGGTGGSPMPDGARSLSTTCTSTRGISSMRTTRNSSKLVSRTRPRANVILPCSVADRPKAIALSI